MFNTLVCAAGFAAVTHAFLIPPSISVADTDIIHSLPFEDAVGIDSQSLTLDCPGCPVLAGSSEDGRDIWMTGLSSTLRADFRIEHFADVDALFFNDVQLHPFDRTISPIPLRLPQILKHAATSEESKDQPAETYITPPLGYAVSIELQEDAKDDIGLLDVSIQIVQIGDIFVDNIENIELKLLQTPSGRMMIADLATAPNHAVGKLAGHCTSVFCTAKALLKDRLSQLRPKRHGCRIDAPLPATKEDRPQLPPGCGSQPCHPHGMHRNPHDRHRHHRHHGFAAFSHAFNSVAFHLMFSIVIGIAAGITASLIGMVVGQAIVLLWRTFYRRGQKGTYSKLAHTNESAEKELSNDKTPLYGQDSPPLYEETVAEKDAKM